MSTKMKGRMDPAVSPVVGVLLMLVVTIIIAAVVSGFAGGLVDNKDKTPQASIDAILTQSTTFGNEYELVFKHLGGDPINTKNVQLITTWTNSTGVTNYQRTSAPSYNDTTSFEYRSGSESNYTLSELNTHYSYNGTDTYYNEPYLVVPGDTPADGTGLETELWWGNYIFKSGDVAKISTTNMGLEKDYTAIWGSGGVQSENEATPVIKNFQYLTENDILNVKLIDSLSGGTIYEKNVNVRG
ncbi:hypothetical protein DLD82_15290 [Methanospirillum stamsii]|uniref:Archaeal Type IV pilin N-terminal domain-containing protein n=2 Tax=Methanospirillum stamsii TaxID=1277351 RepID=A0A2V2N2B3_9EURY|nr:hypothetical protein DLD82_15290 [Methanospirillum stamsii]